MSKKKEFLGEHTIKLQGKDYLLVAARIVAFRAEHPDWSIQTETKEIGGKLYVVAAVSQPVHTSEGVFVGMQTLATAHKEVGKAKGGAARWPLETAETGAIGRALGLCGYGTLCGDFNEGDQLADAPVERGSNVVQLPGVAKKNQAGSDPDSGVPATTGGLPDRGNESRDRSGAAQGDTGARSEFPVAPAKLISTINRCRSLERLEGMRPHLREVVLRYDPGDDERKGLIEAFQSKLEQLEQS